MLRFGSTDKKAFDRAQSIVRQEKDSHGIQIFALASEISRANTHNQTEVSRTENIEEKSESDASRVIDSVSKHFEEREENRAQFGPDVQRREDEDFVLNEELRAGISNTNRNCPQSRSRLAS